MGSATRTPIAWINLKTRRIDLVGAVHCVIAVVPNARAELGRAAATTCGVHETTQIIESPPLLFFMCRLLLLFLDRARHGGNKEVISKGKLDLRFASKASKDVDM